MDLDLTNSGTTIEPKVADSFSIRLADNPATGYAWDFADKGEPVLEIAADRFEGPAQPGRIGAGGTRVLEFRVKSAGTAQLRLLYCRTGMPDPGKTFELTVNARD